MPNRPRGAWEKSKEQQILQSHIQTAEVGDRAKVLLPIEANKTIMKWLGPFVVVDKIKVGELEYRVKLDDGRVKTYHISMLKKDVNKAGPVENHTLATVVTVGNNGEMGYEEEMLELFNEKQKDT